MDGVVKQIESRWHVGDKLRVQHQSPSGEIITAIPTTIGTGDFVNVEVVAVIRRTSVTHVTFAMKTITLLEKGSEVSINYQLSNPADNTIS